QVARTYQRLAQTHRSGETAVRVLRPPFLAPAHPEHDRCIEHDGGRIEAALERRGVDEGLEARAGLAARLGGAVELVAGIAEAADECAQRAGVGFERHQGRLTPWQLVELP